MKIECFESTDTLYIEPYSSEVDKTRDLYEATLLDLGGEGRLCAITIEHADGRMTIQGFSFEQIPA